MSGRIPPTADSAPDDAGLPRPLDPNAPPQPPLQPVEPGQPAEKPDAEGRIPPTAEPPGGASTSGGRIPPTSSD